MKVKELIALLLLAREDAQVFLGLGDEEVPLAHAYLKITNFVWDGETPKEFTPALPAPHVLLTP